jgi:glutathione S-transferase
MDQINTEIPMKLFYSPGACSMGIHILLEETGRSYDAQPLNIREGQQFKSEYTSINPKSKVPTLVRDDGSVLTEWPAIATYIARLNPHTNLLPKDAETESRVLEAVDYIVGTIHALGFNRLFQPAKFAPSDANQEAVATMAKEVINKGFALMDKALAGKSYLVGSPTIADLALFYVEFWATTFFSMSLPPNLAAHFERMKSRPSVRRVLESEGLAA